MIDLPKANAEANEWGISLRERLELQVQVFGNVDPFGDGQINEEPQEEDWRGRVAQVLIENHLAGKANRFLECSRYGVALQCKGPQQHALFSPIYCDLRFCSRCGPRQFARLIEISNNVGPVNSFLSKPLHPLRRVVFDVPFDLCIDDHGSLIIYSVSVRPKHLFDPYFDHD